MRRALILFLLIGAFSVAGAMAQDSPFTSSNPFETAGDKPIRLFGDAEPPAPYPAAAVGDTVLWSAVVSKGDDVPLEGLEQGAFSFELDGRSREISLFARRPATEGDTGFAGPGWYVALFDLTIADPLMMKAAGEKLLAEIDNRLDLDEQVAVVFFDGRVEVVAPFTRDREVIAAALQRIPQRSVYCIHDFFGSRVKVTARGELKMTSTLDQSDDTAQHNFAAHRFFNEIRRLALELARVPGRKQVMLFSGGYNRKWLTKEDVAYLRMVDAMCRATAAVYTYNAVDDDYLDRILEEEGLRRSKKEKAGAAERKYASRLLQELAESTGGLYWSAKSGPEEIVATLFEDGRHHYLLGFPRSAGSRTGIFLPTKVDAAGASGVRTPLGFYDND